MSKRSVCAKIRIQILPYPHVALLQNRVPGFWRLGSKRHDLYNGGFGAQREPYNPSPCATDS